MKSNAVRNSARGQSCTLQIAGVCNGNNDTVVLCHLPSETGGMGMKGHDIVSAYGCSACHDALDRRVYSAELEGDRWYYIHRANVRTIIELINQGILTMKGAK